MTHPNHGDKTVIDGFEVEMLDCDGSLCCFVMHERSSERDCYSASLAALMAEGVLWNDTSPLNVAQTTIDKIETWALAHGY